MIHMINVFIPCLSTCLHYSDDLLVNKWENTFNDNKWSVHYNMFSIQMSHKQQFATAYHFTTMGKTQRVKTFTWNFLLMTRHCVMKSANMLKHVQGIRMKMTHRDAIWVAILCSLTHHLVFPVVSTKRHASHVCIA